MTRRRFVHEPDGLFNALEARRLLNSGGDDLPFTYYYPEGYAHDAISEFVPITNPNDAEVRYELHARYETGERDQILAEGTIPGGTRGGVTINRAGAPQERLVRPDTPYALVLKTSAPVGATISHYDFGTAIGESFTSRTSDEWTFAEGYKDPNWTRDFLIYYNPDDDDADITVMAYTGEGQIITMTTRLQGQRRGGWSFNDEDRIPSGVFGIRVLSNRPIVAALSHYEIVTERGFGAVGAPDGGAFAGVITAIDFDDNNRRGGDDDSGGRRRRGRGGGDDGGGDDGTPDQGPGDFPGGSQTPFPANAYITILNTNNTAATVTLTFIPEDDDVVLPNPQRTIVIPAQSRGGVSIRELGFPLDDEFGVVYRSDVKVTVTAAVYEGRDGTGMQAVDVAATVWKFGEGYMSRLRAGRAVTEDVYIFNPTLSEFTVTIEFFFSTGQRVTITKSLDGLELEDVKADTLLEITNLGEDVFYGVRVTSPVPVVATFEHWDDDLGGGFATPGIPGGTIVSLADILAI